MFKKVAFGVFAVAGVLAINPALGYVAASTATYVLGGGSVMWYNAFGATYGVAITPVATFAGSAGLAGSEMIINYTSSLFSNDFSEVQDVNHPAAPLLVD